MPPAPPVAIGRGGVALYVPSASDRRQRKFIEMNKPLFSGD
jgi:hypothetical protein